MTRVKASKKAKVLLFALMIGFLILGYSPSIGAGADPTWISLTPGLQKAPQANLLESDFNQIVFEIHIPGLWSEEIATQVEDFSLLSISDVGVSSVIGEPNLPVISKMVQIPFGAEVSAELVSFQFVEKSLEEVGVANRIAPVQPPVPKTESAWQEAQFVINEDYYQQDAFLPEERVRLGETGVIRGHRFVNVVIHPISYNPQAGRVRVYSEMRIRLTLSGSDMVATEKQLHRYASAPFEELCQELLMNYPMFHPIVKGAPQVPIGYLIITHQDFYSSAVALAEWKTRKGFYVTVAQVPSIGSTKEAIKGFIEDAYDNWDVPPTYVLFIGDTEDIPHWTGVHSSSATDIEYVKMDSDYFADIFRGRLSAKDPTEAADMVSKILYYENPTAADLDWMGHACFIASDDAGLLAERTHRYVIQNYLAPNGMEADTIWDRLGGSTFDIASCVNGGASIVCYSGHGNTGSWGCVPFYQSDVRALTNQDEYPLVLSHACLTAKFNLYECFGETWVVEDNKAGIAFWGASNLSYWNEDDILEKRMFRAAFAETCYSVGNMTDKALYHLYQYYGGGGLSRYYLDMYNVLGDPSVDLWTYPAESLDVDFPPSVNPAPNTVDVTVQELGGLPVHGVLVCLHKSGEVFETGYTDILGQVTLYPSPLTSGEIDVTVTAHNFLPFMGSMEVGAKIGDVTGDGVINASDVIYLINYLFKEGPAPDPLEMGDANCDGDVNAEDVIYLLNYLYQDGPPPCAG